MKIIFTALFTISLAATALSQVTGTSLNIGTSNTTQSKSGTIGSNNIISNASANNNLLIGDSNGIDSASGTNLLSGYGNGATGSTNMSVLFGAWNWSNGGLANMAVGWGNQMINANNCLAIGFNNYATNWGQFLVGIGLIGGSVGDTSNNPTVVVGSYNVAKADQRFVVGIGTASDSAHRDNALEVSKTGKVTMLKEVTMTKRQGDLGMGRFGNSGDQ